MTITADDEPFIRYPFDLSGANSYPYLLPNAVAAVPLFADAFWQAGKDRCAQLKERGMPTDTGALPIAFLYRHALELALKGLIWNADELAIAEGKTRSKSAGPAGDSHDLSQLAGYADYAIRQYEFSWSLHEGLDWKCARSRIIGLHEIDPRSFNFRYPLNRKGQPSLEEEFGFNIYRFADTFDPVIDQLLSFCFDLETRREDFN